MFASRRRFCGEPHESDKPSKSNLFINEWGFVDDELPIRYTLYAIRYTSIENPTLAHFRHFSSLLTIENPTLVHFRHFSSLLTNEMRFTLRQDARTKKPFYAKQTQFPPILRQKRLFGRKTNPIQTQFKPNQTQFKPNQSQFKPNSNPIQTQSNPIFRPLYLAHSTYSPQSNPIFQRKTLLVVLDIY